MEQIKKKFDKVAKELCELYEKKNKAYGNSFGETFQELGIISAITRISDKFNRLCTLSQNPDIDNIGESIDDTLRDLASYCVMTCVEIWNKGNKGNEENVTFQSMMEDVTNADSSDDYFESKCLKISKKIGFNAFVVYIADSYYSIIDNLKDCDELKIHLLTILARYCILAVANNEPTEPEIIEFP